MKVLKTDFFFENMKQVIFWMSGCLIKCYMQECRNCNIMLICQTGPDDHFAMIVCMLQRLPWQCHYLFIYRIKNGCQHGFGHKLELFKSLHYISTPLVSLHLLSVEIKDALKSINIFWTFPLSFGNCFTFGNFFTFLLSSYEC